MSERYTCSQLNLTRAKQVRSRRIPRLKRRPREQHGPTKLVLSLIHTCDLIVIGHVERLTDQRPAHTLRQADVARQPHINALVTRRCECIAPDPRYARRATNAENTGGYGCKPRKRRATCGTAGIRPSV